MSATCALKFAREMELYLREIGLSHLQHISRVGKEHVATVAVERHILVLSALERFEFSLVVALNPACFVETYGFPAALSAVFVQQAILNDFELQLAHGANDFAAVELVDKHLRYAFVHKLFDAALQLLGLHRVGILNVFEKLW